MNTTATWIWYPGDFEVWLGNVFNNRRTQRGAMLPPFWKQDSHWPTVEFVRDVTLTEPETIDIVAEGQISVNLNGKPMAGNTLDLPAGTHHISIKVWNQATPPALFIDGRNIKTDSTWQATYEDKIWVDENGQAHGAGIYVPVGCWNFNRIDTPPSLFRLPTKPLHPIDTTTLSAKKRLIDFGRETFGTLRFEALRGNGHINICYGESREEAMDSERCETLDRIAITDGNIAAPLETKAFRYVSIEREDSVDYADVLMDYEYAPFDAEKSGSFRCSDDVLNTIWQVSAYTLDLTTREFFTDGIKRDRWTWSGDAIQSYLMNYYLRFDTECVKRTIRQLRGKDPVTAHVNTIMDYTFFWFKSIADYYLYTGDKAFIYEVYPRMTTLMDYVLSRTNTDGMAEGQPDDWIFVDWTDFPMHKRGSLCFEQLLFVSALEAMALCAELTAHDASRYRNLATQLLKKTEATFWSDNHHAYLHAMEKGWLNPQVTKFPNMFAVILGYASPNQQHDIIDHVLLNPEVAPITTPYMRFYELEALCQMGHHSDVLREMKAYWGGMLREGATTFWEKYNPEKTGREHLAMYGRPYGKSLCHAWGASPIYIIGRYFLGVRPTKSGYEEYEVRPVLGGLEWMEGEVPTPFGKIRIKMDSHAVTVCSDGGNGVLIIGNKHINIPPSKETTINY